MVDSSVISLVNTLLNKWNAPLLQPCMGTCARLALNLLYNCNIDVAGVCAVQVPLNHFRLTCMPQFCVKHSIHPIYIVAPNSSVLNNILQFHSNTPHILSIFKFINMYNSALDCTFNDSTCKHPSCFVSCLVVAIASLCITPPTFLPTIINTGGKTSKSHLLPMFTHFCQSTTYT